jgi:hypothetical protein
MLLGWPVVRKRVSLECNRRGSMHSGGAGIAQERHKACTETAHADLAFTAEAEGRLCTRKITGQGVVIGTITLEHPLGC